MVIRVVGILYKKLEGHTLTVDQAQAWSESVAENDTVASCMR